MCVQNWAIYFLCALWSKLHLEMTRECKGSVWTVLAASGPRWSGRRQWWWSGVNTCIVLSAPGSFLCNYPRPLFSPLYLTLPALRGKRNKDKDGSGSVLQGQDTCQLLRAQFIQRLLAAAQLIEWQRQPLWLYNRKEAKQCKAAGSLRVKSRHLAKLAV